ncbi:MAG TPA: phospholipase D-like domain-containing protein [Casimicrobiaceae bacterium]|nr:phospholipase D-like domain-containing protein [Casimicrobiaceae bacterium]
MKSRDVVVAAIAIALTVVVGLIALNFRTGEKQIEQTVARLYETSDPQFQRAMGVLLGPPIIAGNRFDVLVNGDMIFPAMLSAIRSARETITFESYIYWSGDVGRAFAEALAERARAGVHVHLLLDWLGSSKLDPAQLALMVKAGVEVRRFHEPRWYQLARLNNRTHRKLLIVDGKVGFTGGVGIADEWSGNAQDAMHWRDTHFRAEGPVVAQMQAVFMDNWIKVTGNVLHGAGYFPALAAAGASRGQMFSSSPEGGSESMHLMYLLAITAATRSIDLSSAYFVPDALTQAALVSAAKRGVKIRIITPGEHIDAETVRRASRAGWGDLLRAGIEIHEYQPTMFHCKVLVVDALWISVGSTNFDSRSFAINDEANLNIDDAAFARRQIEIFEADLARSKRVTLAAWEQRPLSEKLLEHAAALLRTQL